MASEHFCIDSRLMTVFGALYLHWYSIEVGAAAPLPWPLAINRYIIQVSSQLQWIRPLFGVVNYMAKERRLDGHLDFLFLESSSVNTCLTTT